MRTALVIIDVQRALFDPEPRPFEAVAVLERINALAAQARAAGALVIHVQHECEGSALAFGSEGWAIAREVKVLAGDITVRKTTPDSFLRTSLAEVLSAAQVNTLVICGYATEFCVDSTTRRAAALGYAVQLAADAHTTHDKAHAGAAQIRAHHNATLPNLTSFGPVIQALPAARIHFETQTSAPAPQARQQARVEGAFDVKLQPQAPEDDRPGAPSRLLLDKQFHGALSAHSLGQMLAVRPPEPSSAGYVAMELVTGTLQGRSGSFALQHSGHRERGASRLQVSVVADSGTGELKGLSGEMDIIIEQGAHRYVFDYSLPQPVAS